MAWSFFRCRDGNCSVSFHGEQYRRGHREGQREGKFNVVNLYVGDLKNTLCISLNGAKMISWEMERGGVMANGEEAL